MFPSHRVTPLQFVRVTKSNAMPLSGKLDLNYLLPSMYVPALGFSLLSLRVENPSLHLQISRYSRKYDTKPVKASQKKPYAADAGV